MCKQSRQCINCRYFSRRFNRFVGREYLKEKHIGYCMYNPPSPNIVTIADKNDMYISIPALVYEESSCCKFDLEVSPDIIPPWEKNESSDKGGSK